MGPNELAWLRIDQELKIGDAVRENGAHILPMSELKRVGQREIRLLLKQDRRRQVPSFLDGGGTMSVSNSDVLFYQNDLHQTLPVPKKIENIDVLTAELPPLVDPWFFTSEPEAIDVVETLGGLDNFTSDKLRPRSTGRHKIFKPFNMKLRNSKIGPSVEITNPQVESDAWWVGEDAGYVLEAKIGSTSELHRRQLFYPYHDMNSRLSGINSSLETRTLSLISRGEGVFDLYEFSFEDEFDILSCEVVNSKRIQFHRKEQLRLPLETVQNAPNYSAPFPQADSLSLVMKTFERIHSGSDVSEWVFETGYDKRQYDYYFSACKWLGFFEGTSTKPLLTNMGMEFSKSSRDEKKLIIGSVLNNDYVFSHCMNNQIKQIRAAATDLILDRGEKYRVRTRVTADRRAQTVRAWLVSLGLHQ